MAKTIELPKTPESNKDKEDFLKSHSLGRYNLCFEQLIPEWYIRLQNMSGTG